MAIIKTDKTDPQNTHRDTPVMNHIHSRLLLFEALAFIVAGPEHLW